MGEATGEDAGVTGVIRGANPFVGLTRRQTMAAAGRWATHLARRPTLLASSVAGFAAEELRIAAGRSSLHPDPRDRRFVDPAWQGPVWRRVAQTYLAGRDAILGSVDELDLDDKSADRARFALMQITEMAAPTNVLAGNPAALKRAAETRGRSLARGARHLAHDVRRNGGMPSQVDTRPFTVGENVAVAPGAVVHRTELFELIQYQPTTAQVHERPVLIVPPQVNRFYFIDLAPKRSFVEYVVSRGVQTFLISWRNPKPVNREWSLDTYAAAIVEALEVVADISGSPDCNAIGFCAGGITLSAVMAHLEATDQRLVESLSLAVTTIDTAAKSTMNAFASERSVAAAIRKSRRKGMLEGSELAKVFAWVRPNDLVWNYVVSNYLMGENPPAFDILAWNADVTNLPAALHAEFVQLFTDNLLLQPGGITTLGTPVDLGTITTDVYMVAAINDHLVPWQAVYEGTQAFGGDVRFVLSNSGHIAALINPPDNPKASYLVGDDQPSDPALWLKEAERTAGSWWTDWTEWVLPRSGGRRPKPRKLGNRNHPIIEPAPGRYVLER